MQSHILLGSLIFFSPSVFGIPLDVSSFSKADTIQRDVVIVGGGASGTHAAIRLKDLGTTVVVVEKAGELGGHTNTWTGPGGARVDFGVSNFQNYTVVRDFFARFNIPLTTYSQPGIGDKYADFATGIELPAGTIPAPDFTAYFAQLAKYPYLEIGWNLPQPVPEDLLLPFGKLVEKYSLQNVAYFIAQFAAGNGNVLDQTTVYVLKAVDRPYLEGIFGSAITPVTHDTHEIYEKALQALGPNALLSSTVTDASRSNRGVALVVKTPNGKKLIQAKKLLITAPPKLESLNPFNLDKREKNIFSQFESKALYVSLLKDTGLAAGYRYYNAKPDTKYNLAQFPGPEFLWATRTDGIFWGWYSSPTEKSESTVKSELIAAVKKLAPGANPSIVAYDSHTPSAVGVTPDKIKSGFYKNLLSLQGYRNTWYTGSTWVSDHSAALWNHTEYELLPKLKN